MSEPVYDRRRVALAFGAVLRRARLQRGLSQEDLAFDSEFDRTYPSLLERGLRTPTLPVLLTLAATLRVEPAFLLDETLLTLQAESSQTFE